MKQGNGKLNRVSIFKKREQYTYHSALQRTNQNGGKENRGKTNEEQPSLTSQLPETLRCHFLSQGRGREERTREDQKDRASKRTAAVKKGPAKAGRDAGSPGSGGRAARWTRAWPLSRATVARSGGRSQTPSGAASEKPLRTSALPRGRPRPTTPARGCAGRSRRRERPLPPQAFVHEAQIPAGAVAVLILDFRLPRHLHGTGEGERGRYRRPAQGREPGTRLPGWRKPGPKGRSETPLSNRRRALSRPDGVVKPEAGDSR